MSELSANNRVMQAAATSAMGALFALNDMGCVIRSIEITGRRPVFVIDPPPKGFLQGAVKRRIAHARSVRCVMVAAVHGAQVEWEVSTLRELVA